MAVIFPFEVNFYQKFNVPVKFVGNPLLKMIQNRLPVEEAKKLFNLKSEYQTIGLFPGSRSSEIKRLLPIMLETAELLSAKNSKLQFILSQASSITDQELAQHLATSNLSIKVVSGHNYNVMQVCDAIISASGTATLEIALLAIPLVIIYKISWWEYEIAKRLIKIPYVGLCNILAQKLVVPELLQNDATPEKIAQAIETIIQNQGYEQQMVIELKKIRQIFEETEKTEIAVLVKNLLESTS